MGLLRDTAHRNIRIVDLTQRQTSVKAKHKPATLFTKCQSLNCCQNLPRICQGYVFHVMTFLYKFAKSINIFSNPPLRWNGKTAWGGIGGKVNFRIHQIALRVFTQQTDGINFWSKNWITITNKFSQNIFVKCVWCMVYGALCMLYGVWCMVYGEIRPLLESS